MIPTKYEKRIAWFVIAAVAFGLLWIVIAAFGFDVVVGMVLGALGMTLFSMVLMAFGWAVQTVSRSSPADAEMRERSEQKTDS